MQLASVAASTPEECASLCANFSVPWQKNFDDTLHYNCEVWGYSASKKMCNLDMMTGAAEINAVLGDTSVR